MKFYIFHSQHDARLLSYPFFQSPKLITRHIRQALHDQDCYQAMILLSDHHLSSAIVNIIRKTNYIIPIFIISKMPQHIMGINGVIHPDNLTINYIHNLIHQYPQRLIWNDVFNLDQSNRKALNCG